MKLRIRTLTVIFIILGFPAGISGQTPKRILIFRTVGHTCPKRINFQVHLEDSILRIEKSLILVAPKGESGAVEPPSISAGTLILKSPQRFAVKLSSEEQDLCSPSQWKLMTSLLGLGRGSSMKLKSGRSLFTRKDDSQEWICIWIPTTFGENPMILRSGQ